MTHLMISKKTLVLLFAILILGLFLRHKDFRSSPRLGATFDEYAWTWLGMSLIEKHTPSSWSSYPQYEGYREYKKYQGATFWIVKPYLEHPPLFGLIAGSFAIANGAKSMFDVDLEKIRPLALILGVLSIFIIFLLVKELYDEKTALLASFIYALIPTVVIGSRLVQNENFFIPVFLLSLFLIFRFIKTKKDKFFLLAAFICGLLTLAKVPWIAAGISIGLILLYNRKYKHFLLLVGIVISIFSLFIIYAYYYNWDLFISLWKFQFQRYEMAFNSVFTLFAEPYLADRFTIDGWIYFGWISFFLLLAKNLRKNYILIFGLLGYLAVFVFAIPNTPGHGWYKYPFYPFLAISLAIFIKDHFNKNLLFTFMFILFTGLSLLELTWTKTFGFSFSILRIFILLAGTSLLPLFFKNSKLKKYSRVFNYLMLIFIFFLSIWAVLAYNEQ